mgnify:FL=1
MSVGSRRGYLVFGSHWRGLQFCLSFVLVPSNPHQSNNDTHSPQGRRDGVSESSLLRSRSHPVRVYRLYA